MKKIVIALLFIYGNAEAATLVPPQLINPSGSSSGQAIVSTGSSTAPGWASVTLSGLASIAANTVVANATSGSAAPAAFSMPSCSTSSSALNWTTNTGFTCGTVASSGANSNITSLTGLTTPLSVAQGGTGTNAATIYNVAVGAATNIGYVTPSATSGVPLISNGSAAYPSFSTALPAGGGTGLTTITAHNVMVGEGTSNVAPVAPTATTGVALVSNGSSSDPSFGAVNIASGSAVTGTLAVGNGGTGITSFGTGVATALGQAVTGSGGIVETTSPTISTPTINGITSGSAAGSGVVAQVITHSTTSTSITSGATVNADTISVPAGDWDCWGQVLFVPAATTIVADIAGGFNTTSATLAASPQTSYLGVTLATGTNGITTLNVFHRVTNVSSTTNLFLTAEATSVTVSTATVNGYTSCRRRE